MHALAVVRLAEVMKLTSGSPAIVVGLIDGPVALDHADLDTGRLRELRGNAACSKGTGTACTHGTFVAGILSARRSSSAPAICPDCTLLVCPVFAEWTPGDHDLPSATPDELAAAVLECIEAGARVLNLSLALAHPSSKAERALEQALDHAARRGVLVVAAAGNQGTVGSSSITRHPWVIPVAACDPQGRPIAYTNLSHSAARHGLCAPGEDIVSLATGGSTTRLGGTSVAAPFVTGTIALLWSLFPGASAAQVKLSITQAGATRRRSLVPPLLDAWGAHQVLAMANLRRRAS